MSRRVVRTQTWIIAAANLLVLTAASGQGNPAGPQAIPGAGLFGGSIPGIGISEQTLSPVTSIGGDEDGVSSFFPLDVIEHPETRVPVAVPETYANGDSTSPFLPSAGRPQ